MTNTVMRIKREDFCQLIDGRKSLEVRVGYANIKKIKKGETVSFEDYGTNSFLVKRVSNYASFSEMLDFEGVEKAMPGMTYDDALLKLMEVYSPEKEALGVYVFELKHLKDGALPIIREKTLPHEILRASELLKEGRDKAFSKIVVESYMMTNKISEDYPDYCDHYYTKDIPGIFDGERELFAVYSKGSIIAMAITKKTKEEKKLCTFYVKSEYRGSDIMTELAEACFKWLGTSRPLASVPEHRQQLIVTIVNKYHWEQTDVLEGYYKNGSNEVVYNGHLD